MKNINRILIILLGSIFLGACSKETLDRIDTDPNNPSDVPTKTLLTSVTTGVTFNVFATDLAWYTSIFSEQTAGVHGQMLDAELRTGGVNTNSYGNPWNSIYYKTLKDLSIIEAKASKEGNKTAVGIAQVLQSITYSVLTDLFGDIPYSEALKAPEVKTPKYDKQVDIYTGILKVLDIAIANLEEKKGNVGGEDFIFLGDASKWIKTAYAIKARVMNRVIDTDVKYKDASITDDDILDAISKSFISSDDNFTYSAYQDAQGWRNTWEQEERERGHHSISRTFYDLLDSNSDPRLAVSIDTTGIDTKSDNYDPEDMKGKSSGDNTNDQGKTKYPILSENVLNATSKLPMLTYEELQFIKAEALLRKGNSTEAEASFREGVKSSLVQFDVSDAFSTSVSYNGLQSIIEQKYIANWPFGSIEAYTEYRRTGFPTLNNPKNKLGEFPQRLQYIQDELVSNPNAPKGINVYTQKLIWAK